ncbi:MAG: hypothetical protein A3E07_02495 [Candidatus Wildermuthbacteria bacterium RIFCSPHIGHO2_12_FULL_45_9]|uniref:Uncharacterized protein n=1 Tax=Candidatus Wildermuthbacteria bacterium RIFCSPHIGHO2_02_FULL_45_25 TaxID=1802450 RepID=A0A1G2R0Z7_9BACT|nr:MAG: hypothetical protein A2748_01000 [Candidatus Wildermuthbacteria bacterium RIFCSPHIGHO2_01_FULL_45_20]OHA66453.1 MAG: hypothetical protein A3C04_01375 [Candidatus Wildermuthbacteria bacterium RIFCSPHIGHO2_02_FULL_45_25]OHA71487.1 MAG: hypothetical protein A3E07_02495 [Candidatus Wildermuthbacteria bacterium RIFCSPHIGHO2_12_FULL_45_9]
MKKNIWRFKSILRNENVKYRGSHDKIKYEHHLIPGLDAFLRKEIFVLEYVKSIIPGRISKSKGGQEKLKVTFQYETPSGAKLLAKGSKVVQEVFVVTQEPEKLKEVIEER